MKNNSFEVLKKIIAALLVISAVFCLSACGGDSKTDKNGYKKIGSGENDFYLEVQKSDKEISKFHIFTDEVMVGSALEMAGLITYAKTEKGEIYVATCDGKKVDYETNGEFWALYNNNEYISSSPNEEAIMCASVYVMKIDKIKANGLIKPSTKDKTKKKEADSEETEATDSGEGSEKTENAEKTESSEKTESGDASN